MAKDNFSFEKRRKELEKKAKKEEKKKRKLAGEVMPSDEPAETREGHTAADSTESAEATGPTAAAEEK